MTGKRVLESLRARERELSRARERDQKQRRIEGDPSDMIVNTQQEREQEDEGFVNVPPAADKSALYRVLNAFQSSPDFGIYVCEQFRDPRHTHIDAYYHEVENDAFGLSDLCRLVGKPGTPLSDRARAQLLRFADTLESLARRTRAAVEGGQEAGPGVGSFNE